MRPTDPQRESIVGELLRYDVKATAKLCEEHFPDAWRRMRVRTIHAPGNYYSSKLIQVGLTSAIAESKAGRLQTNVGIIAGALEQYDFPIYHVAAPLLDALKHSHPPKEMTWADLKLPFPAMMFMVPRGSLVEPEPTKGDIAVLGFAKLEKNKKFPIPTVGEAESISEDRISVFWIVGPSGLECNDTTFPLSHPLEPLVDWIDSRSKGAPYGGPSSEFTSVMAGLIANFILVMEARKELVEPGSVIRTLSRPGRSIHSPTWIGRNYAVLRKDHEDSDRKAQFTELGWRAGHFKRQRFGPKNEQQKTIFVDPYIAYVRGLQKLGEHD